MMGTNTRFPFAIICLISVWLLLNTVNGQPYTLCCCGLGYRLNIPVNVVDECLYQHDYFTDQWSQEYNGYASRTDACGNCDCSLIGQCNSADSDWVPFFQDEYTLVYQRQSIQNNCGNTVSITRTWDSPCGSLSQVIGVVDSIAPELFIPPTRTQECVSTDGIAGPEFDINELDNYFGSARATDLCTNPTLTESIVSSNIDSCNYQIIRGFIADDQCNQTPRLTQEVHFIDSTPPVIYSITSGSSLTFTCDQTTLYSSTNIQPTATDSCDNLNGAIPTVISEIKYEGRCSGEYSIERTWGVSDRCNNQGLYLQTIIVEDPDPPLVSRDGGAYQVPENHYDISFCVIPPPSTYLLQDNCDVSVRGASYLSIKESSTGVNELESHFDVIRSYRATDDCGNYVEWEDVINVNRGSRKFTLNAPSEIAATKGNNIVIIYLVSEISCLESYLLFDIGAAEFVSITLPNCSNGNGGNIYCPVSGDITASVTLTIFVPTSYAPNFLEVRQSTSVSSPFEHIVGNTSSRTIIQFS